MALTHNIMILRIRKVFYRAIPDNFFLPKNALIMTVVTRSTLNTLTTHTMLYREWRLMIHRH